MVHAFTFADRNPWWGPTRKLNLIMDIEKNGITRPLTKIKL